MEVRGMNEFKTFSGYSNIVSGFADGTSISTTANMTKCNQGFQSIDTGLQKTFAEIASNFTLYGTMLAFDLFLTVPYSLLDINFSCYYGLFEMKQQLE